MKKSVKKSKTLNEAKYNGVNYDAKLSRKQFSQYHTNSAPLLLKKFLNGYSGKCLDLGCGTGLNSPTLIELGFDVTGVDISSKQLETAIKENRLKNVVQADVAALPFENDSFDVIVSCYTHSDFDDWSGTMNEVSRVLKPGGQFLYLGWNPYLFGPHAKLHINGKITIFPGYYHGNGERIYKGPGFTPGGLREKVGWRQLPYSDLCNAVLKSGMIPKQFVEAEVDPPIIFGFMAAKEDTKTLNTDEIIKQYKNHKISDEVRQKVSVVCGWSPEFGEELQNLAEDLGYKLGEAGFDLVYGGSAWGMMGSVASGIHKGNGKVYGVSTTEMRLYEEAPTTDDELILCDTILDRKKAIIELGKAFVILPGGLGTIDEMLDMMSLSVKGLSKNPVIVLNHNGYYDGFLNWMRDLAKKKYILESLECLEVVNSTDEVIERLKRL